ncbi:MAG: DUF4301 family protein, partial [Acidobacteriota bacterium]
PASGAASRMFKPLVAVHRGEAGDPERAEARRFLAELRHLPFSTQLAETLGGALPDDADGDPIPVLAALLDDEGLGFATSAKALIPFHRYEDGARTALEDHLVEAAEHLADNDGRCRVHFTVPQNQRQLFEARLEEIRDRLRQRLGVELVLSSSIQHPSTDTVAAELDGRPFRLEDGSLLLRPGGHGALLRNLEDLDADLVFVRNIDNIQPDHRRPEVVRWNRILGGYLLDIEARITALMNRLEAGDVGHPELDGGLRWVAEVLSVPRALDYLDRPARAKRGFLFDILDRPLRLCGMVPNLGEPGGGPYWVHDEDGSVSLQIVEASQIDRDDPEQGGIVAKATHFNPVHLLCRLRSHRGDNYPLRSFVDHDTVFVSQKSVDGRSLLALEHPGLWNGAMGRWNTVFVEVPAAIFAPVKTVFDLLRPEHQSR